jgi:hypothetical protein
MQNKAMRTGRAAQARDIAQYRRNRAATAVQNAMPQPGLADGINRPLVGKTRGERRYDQKVRNYRQAEKQVRVKEQNLSKARRVARAERERIRIAETIGAPNDSRKNPRYQGPETAEEFTKWAENTRHQKKDERSENCELPSGLVLQT